MDVVWTDEMRSQSRYALSARLALTASVALPDANDKRLNNTRPRLTSSSITVWKSARRTSKGIGNFHLFLCLSLSSTIIQRPSVQLTPLC